MTYRAAVCAVLCLVPRLVMQTSSESLLCTTRACAMLQAICQVRYVCRLLSHVHTVIITRTINHRWPLRSGQGSTLVD
jgi:hypothetical protein